MNTWMNNPQYLAQVGHFLGGLCLMLLATLAAIIWGHRDVIPCATFGVGLLLAGVKEFWYDMKYELPKQTWADSGMDFCFYALGGMVGVTISGLTLFALQHSAG